MKVLKKMVTGTGRFIKDLPKNSTKYLFRNTFRAVKFSLSLWQVKANPEKAQAAAERLKSMTDEQRQAAIKKAVIHKDVSLFIAALTLLSLAIAPFFGYSVPFGFVVLELLIAWCFVLNALKNAAAQLSLQRGQLVGFEQLKERGFVKCLF